MHVPSHSRRMIALVTACVAATGLAIGSAPGATAAAGGTVAIPGTVPAWLSHAKPAPTARTAGSQSIRVYLSPNGGLAALQAKAASLSNPASSEYRHWLTPASYQSSYGPTKAAADAVSSYLTSQGLKVTGVEANRRYVSASGSQAQLNKAFGVSLASYVHGGQTVTASATAAKLPAAVAADVLTITGLDTTAMPKKHNSVTPAVTPPPGFANGRPCSINYGNPLATYQADYKTPLPKFEGKTLSYAPCGYTGPQFRAAYEGGTSLFGAGVTVAITDAYAWQLIAQDSNKYAELHGDGSYLPGQLTQNLPSSFNRQGLCGPSGWSGEETLDVEAVHAMAPEANIRYYASASCFDDDFLTALGKVVDENKAQIVTNSWSDLEENESAGSVMAYEQVFLQGATQGITFMFSSGDNGDELANSGVRQVDYPASDPYVTGIGGTSTGIAYGTTTFQTGWGTQSYLLSADGKSWQSLGFLYGAGGGYSALFNRPSYQQGVVPPTAPVGRAVPDIAMDADPNTGMLIGQTQAFPDSVHYGEYRIGGTSLASPLMAGFTALWAQKTGSGFGLLNPLLYSTPEAVIDVKAVNVKGDVRVNNLNGVDPTDGVSYYVRTFNQDSSLATRKGWDPVTGLGIPSPALLASAAAKG